MLKYSLTFLAPGNTIIKNKQQGKQLQIPGLPGHLRTFSIIILYRCQRGHLADSVSGNREALL